MICACRRYIRFYGIHFILSGLRWMDHTCVFLSLFLSLFFLSFSLALPLSLLLSHVYLRPSIFLSPSASPCCRPAGSRTPIFNRRLTTTTRLIFLVVSFCIWFISGSNASSSALPSSTLTLPQFVRVSAFNVQFFRIFIP